MTLALIGLMLGCLLIMVILYGGPVLYAALFSAAVAAVIHQQWKPKTKTAADLKRVLLVLFVSGALFIGLSMSIDRFAHYEGYARAEQRSLQKQMMSVAERPEVELPFLEMQKIALSASYPVNVSVLEGRALEWLTSLDANANLAEADLAAAEALFVRRVKEQGVDVCTELPWNAYHVLRIRRGGPAEVAEVVDSYPKETECSALAYYLANVRVRCEGVWAGQCPQLLSRERLEAISGDWYTNGEAAKLIESVWPEVSSDHERR